MDRKNEKKEKIMNVALKLFINKGFHGTPTSLIAKEAKIATGTLFNYFSTKEILINEVYKYVKKKELNYVLDEVGNIYGKKNKLKRIWNNVILWGLNNPNEKKFLEYFNNSYYISESSIEALHKNYRTLIELFNEIGKLKKLSDVEIRLITFNFIGSCLYTEKYFRVGGEEYSQELSEKSFEIFCKGINLTYKD